MKPRRPLHHRAHHGEIVELTLDDGEVIVDKFVDSGHGRGKVLLRHHKAIRLNQISKFKTHNADGEVRLSERYKAIYKD